MISISKHEPEKINEMPKDIQKLLWRAFFYLSQLENYLDKFSFRRDEVILKKFYGYCMALQNIEKIIEKKCKQKGIEMISLSYSAPRK